MILAFNVLSFGVEYGVFGQLHNTLIVTVQVDVKLSGNMGLTEIRVDLIVINVEWNSLISTKPEFEKEATDIDNFLRSF